MKSFLLVFLGITLFFQVGAFAAEDQPDPGETFSHFFTRITKGGRFRGITLNAPDNFQTVFYKEIKRGTWIGRRDGVYKKLANQNVNMWGQWYQSDLILDFIFPTDQSRKDFFPYFEQDLKENADCAKTCRTPDELRQVPWSKWQTPEIYSFTKAYVLKAPIFGGKTLVGHLADQYGGDPAAAITDSDFYILNNADFEKKVRQLGWDGPIYFRGITAPDPKNAQRRVILMNNDLMRKMTPFDRPLLQLLEYTGILTHEMSHVFQDQRARTMGIDLEANSFEGLMVLEGFAEYLAEQAEKKAAESLSYPSALGLFAVENGVEVVFRDGNEQTGNLFPYTVGLPFAAAVMDMEKENSPAFQKQTYGVITGPETLEEFLNRLISSL